MVWQLQAAKQRFSELVERATREGPQLVTKNGKEAVVVMSVGEYRSLSSQRDNLLTAIQAAPDLDLLDIRRSDDQGREVSL